MHGISWSSGYDALKPGITLRYVGRPERVKSRRGLPCGACGGAEADCGGSTRLRPSRREKGLRTESSVLVVLTATAPLAPFPFPFVCSTNRGRFEGRNARSLAWRIMSFTKSDRWSPVVEQEDSAGTALRDEGDEGDVGFGCVAGAAGEDQVVRAGRRLSGLGGGKRGREVVLSSAISLPQ